jgi:hypothetical protein
VSSGGESQPETRNEHRSEASGNQSSARRDAQHSLDLGAPRHEEGRSEPHQERAPAQEASPRDTGPARESEHDKTFTVWTSSPSPTTSSWGPGGPVRRDE